MNVLSRDHPGAGALGDIYPGPGGRGVCVFVFTIEKVYIKCSRQKVEA